MGRNLGRTRIPALGRMAVVALIGALSLIGCAKDSGGGGGTSASGTCGKAAQPPNAPVPTSSSAPAATKADASKLNVGLAFDLGGPGDASFNDAAIAGLDKAVDEIGLKRGNVKELTAKENEDEAAKETRLKQLAGGGYGTVVAVGFAYTDAVAKVAKRYPNIKFALVDSSVEGATNVTPLLFAENEGSFLSGVIAALKTRKCHIGFIGGVQTPLIQKFEAGYVDGAKSVYPNITIEKDYLTPLGDNSGFNAPDKAGTSASGMLGKGADVIYAAAGASGIGAFQAIEDSEGAKAIGVDSDQYNQPATKQVRDVIISSMLKRVDVAVFDFIAAVANNDLSTIPTVFDLKVNGVDYARSGGQIDDIAAVVDKYKNAIIAGKITVPEKP